MDPMTGALTPVGSVSGVDNPSFLAIEPRRMRLYAVNESIPPPSAPSRSTPDREAFAAGAAVDRWFGTGSP